MSDDSDDRRGSAVAVPPEHWTAEEALIGWTLCTRLAEAIWAHHEEALVTQLLAEEERRARCEHHPWCRRPCPRCEEGENLELVFDDIDPPF